MPMTAAMLKTNLEAMGLYDNEPDAVEAWAEAWKGYFEQASVAGVPVLPAVLPAAKAAMKGGMSGLSSSGAAAIQAGIVAWWGAITPAAFPPAIAVAPPAGIAGIAAALAGVFAANTSGELSEADSMDAIAQALHGCNLGGIATLPGPPPVPTPIL